MKLETTGRNGDIRIEEVPITDWPEAIEYITFLFGKDPDAAIMIETEFDNGRKAASIRDKNRKIIYQLKTIK